MTRYAKNQKSLGFDRRVLSIKKTSEVPDKIVKVDLQKNFMIRNCFGAAYIIDSFTEYIF